MIRLNILNFDQLSSGGVPWSDWCPVDPTQIESIKPGRDCRGFQDVSIVRTKSGDAFWVGQSVAEIEQILYKHRRQAEEA